MDKMQRQLSNVSFYSYQDYQPTRKYGPQYEPGGYAAAVQQRTNMTQREDALKFEQSRIKTLQEERLHIQKKTFTKWMNSFLQKARMEVEDLFIDLADGRRLLKLLEIISGERLPRPNSGRMRVHKIENVNKSLSFLHTKVRLESIGAEDIVDGNPRLILGLIWTIILRFQIQEIEIDVDEENESSEKKSAKDALLLWCQRKTSGYHGVHISNFSDSWRSGLGFNALIHAHRPDLFRWNDLPVAEPVETLNHAFDTAHKNLGIPKLLDAEDVDVQRPDEKSVMTYVASYYHTFARMKNEQKSGRRIANILGQLIDCDGRKSHYSRLITTLLEWITSKILELNDRQLPNSLDAIQRTLLAFNEYRTQEKPPKYKERSEIEALYFDINTMQKSLVGESWTPLEGQLPQDLERAWQRLEQAEHAREIALRTELLRQQRLEQLNYKFNTKSVLRKGYLKEMIQVLSDPRYGSNLPQVDATVKKHEAISADILARTERFEDLTAMAAELVRENYHGAEAVSKCEQSVLARWKQLLELLEKHRVVLSRLAHLVALQRDADSLSHELSDIRAQFQSEEVGRHLTDVERLLQAHALQELQLNALNETIAKLVRQGNAAEGPEAPKKQLTDQLTTLQEEYDSLMAAAKDRKARLEDARSLYQFLEDHEEEEGWVTEKQRICRADVAAKDLRGVVALKQKHAALLHEIKAREHVSQRHRSKGQSLIEAGHPRRAEVERRLSSLSAQWDSLHSLAQARDKKLADAAEAYQFYGDANESESWMKEKRPLVSSKDVGRDAPEARALLARHKALDGEILAYRSELDALATQADRLRQAGIESLQLPTEVEPTAESNEEWVKETRLVPTDVWEEEAVERLEHRTVTEERAVPQVKALYPFTGQGISMSKGEVMFLMNKASADWWSVRKADRTDGFVPANYVQEIEPRLVPVQVRRPEKVRSVQRVKKTVLVKQVVPVRRAAPALRRGTKAATTPPVEPRLQHIKAQYEELQVLSASRREALEDAIKLFNLFGECEELDKWGRDKERMLQEEQGDNIDTAKRKYEKFVTDLSAASKRLEEIDSATEALVSQRHSQAKEAVSRRNQLKQLWQRLLAIKLDKERSLEGASSVELFGRTCDEALDWMREKEEQIKASTSSAADLRTVRALQRRHAQLERELEPLREKVNTVTLLADSVKSQYPNEKSNVESRQHEIHAMWQRCQQQANERRRRLENAVGHQIFVNGCATLREWMLKTREQLAQEAKAKDVATAEELIKQHNELRDDMKAHDDEYKEVIGLGKKLVANNPSLSDVADTVKSLEKENDDMNKEWRDKSEHLKQLLQVAQFNREADQIDASTGALEAYCALKDTGSSVELVEALMKRHEELEARLVAQDDRLSALRVPEARSHAAEHMSARLRAATERRARVRSAASERRRALTTSRAHHQFLEGVEELENWIQDKTRTANDQNYKDLANLERKLQKHEAFERELQANEKQLRNVESVGQSLQTSDPTRAPLVTEKLDGVRKAWQQLVAASRDKGSKLRQARDEREFKRSIEEARSRLEQLERALTSEETGADLRTCKRLLNQHQVVEQELVAMESRCDALCAAGQELLAAGHYAGDSLLRAATGLREAASRLRGPHADRQARLATTMRLHKFAAEVAAEMDWLEERKPLAQADSLPTDLHSGQTAVKKHAKLKAELKSRKPLVERIVKQGDELCANGHPNSDKIKALSSTLEDTYQQVSAAAQAREKQLDARLKAAQLLQEAAEVESWLGDKARVLAGPLPQDCHRATKALANHKAMELELDTYAAIISEMQHTAVSLSNSGHEMGPQLVTTCDQLTDTLHKLQRMAAERQKGLLQCLHRHEYMTESAELESWIQDQYAAASSEDYGQDYEHLLILKSKFDELRHRVESGAERFNQCEEIAKKLLASESPFIPDIEKRQEALGEAWQGLVDQIQSRASRLHAAGEIHRFHRDVAELITRAAEKRSQLLAYNEIPLSALRARDNMDSDLVAIDAQMQVLQEEGTRLQKQYPGGNVGRIQQQQAALAEAWKQLEEAAANRRQWIQEKTQLRSFLQEVRDLSSWMSSCRAALCAAGSRAAYDALRHDVTARDHAARDVLARGEAMLNTQHPHEQEIEEKCVQLANERSLLAAACARKQVQLDQQSDLECFLRDSKVLLELSNAQEALMNAEIPADWTVEDVNNALKKHEAFEKLLVTQDEKLATLNTHGDKLLQQNHVDSQQIADELQLVNERRKKVHSLAAARRSGLQRALLRASFWRAASSARAATADKLSALRAHHSHGEVTNLEDKIKKLQKHQAFKAELVANEARLKEIEELANQLREEPAVWAGLNELKADWQRLRDETEQRGRGLEEAQDMLEFNQHLDEIEAWIRDKEIMVMSGETGRDYEHCASLVRKLDSMPVESARVEQLCAVGDRLLQQGPSKQSKAVAERRDAFLAKWQSLSGALQKYREDLATALKIHAFNRDVQDTSERISQKAALFASKSRGRDLAAAHELHRKHDALQAEATAVRAKIHELEVTGQALANDYPTHAAEISERLAALKTAWTQLQELAAERTAFLDRALHDHRFHENLKELELWVGEGVSRMRAPQPAESALETQDLEHELQQHHEIKAEIDGRQKAIAALKQTAVQQLASQDSLPEKLARLEQLSATLDSAWRERKDYLTQAHQLQQLNGRAQLVEDWLAEKEAFLNNDDLGDNMDAVETLTRKHEEFTKLVECQSDRVTDLQEFASSLLAQGHGSQRYAERRIQDIVARAQRLKELCNLRSVRLAQSRQLQQFLRDLAHERDWIQHKHQPTAEHNYRDLSNLQSKIQKHAAFESELAANKTRIDDVANHGEELIEAKHYASKEIAQHVEGLEKMWQELQESVKLRRERLQESYQARVFLRSVDDLTSWLQDVESQLFSDEHGKDLAALTALLKRHARLEQQVASKSETATQISENARQLAESGHFMADEICEKADEVVQRYRQLQEPIQIRKDNLEDAAILHRWTRDVNEEIKWLQEREPAINSKDMGSNLAEAQTLQKKHLALDAELSAREPTITSLIVQAESLSRRGHFASSQLEASTLRLKALFHPLCDASAARVRRLATNIEILQLLTELSEAETYLLERRTILASTEVGTSGDMVVMLQKRLHAAQRELLAHQPTVVSTQARVQAVIQDRQPCEEIELLKDKMADVTSLYDELKLLSAKREQRLQQSLKYYKFASECAEVQEWVVEQMQLASSEEYGQDVEHVETLQQHFDYALRQLHANSGRVEMVLESGAALLEENSPEAPRVSQSMQDVRGLWEDALELAKARQEALAGARQVHELDRSADETVAWIEEKTSLLRREGSAASSRADLHARKRRMEALRADLDAILAATHRLQDSASQLGEQYPDAKEHVTAKLEEVQESMTSLQSLFDTSCRQVALAEQLQAYFGTCQELLAWCNETLARVTAPDLAADVPSAERLLARHKDIRAEMTAKDDLFNNLYKDGEKLVKEGHFMSPEIAEKMSTVRNRREQLDQVWAARETIYEQHLDALLFKRDADALDAWISSREPLVRDNKLGDTIPHVEELINRHQDLEETIESQKERLHALKRITLVEKAFSAQKEEEEAARRVSEQRLEDQRLQQWRQREVDRITAERRAENPPHMDESLSKEDTVEEMLSPAPQFEKLPKAEGSAVKRAESMQVVAPRRTPSFTTRRRAHSFRRGDAALPPTEIEGFLERKQIYSRGGGRAALRSWRGYHTVLCGQLLCFFRGAGDFASARAAAPPLPIHQATCTPAEDYTKRGNVFRLRCEDGGEYLFACTSRELMMEWIQKVTFHAQLPPQLQLTPYSASDKEGKQRNPSSSSSSAHSSPETQRKPRSQAEILQQHRNSQLSQRNIESSVLPSLPPRQPEIPEDDSGTFTRNEHQASWGRTRFSNGRDINAEFIKSQRDATAPALPSSGPPPIPERAPNIAERAARTPEKQRVSSLVQNYQQKTRNLDGNGNPQNVGSLPNTGNTGRNSWQNNNWNVETTSHFYAGNEFAYGGSSGGNTRPASVAGSGGSPSMDQRPTSRSSGESELSVSGLPKDKKDKKGVFGGLFSRKKRPHNNM